MRAWLGHRRVVRYWMIQYPGFTYREIERWLIWRSNQLGATE